MIIYQPIIPLTLRCHLQVDVASHSPGGGPAVSHDPVGFGCAAVVAHRHDAMVLAQRRSGAARWTASSHRCLKRMKRGFPEVF